MPAIHPARMKIQVAQLTEKLRQPQSFVRELHNLLENYADRTYRPGQFGEPPPLLATYKTPPPVLRQIERTIFPLADSDPAAALALVDALWAEPVIEFRQLAIQLLGRIPPTPPEPVLVRIQTWVTAMPETRLLDIILEQSLARIRQELPDNFYDLVENWLEIDQTYPQQAGLRALGYVINDPGFENLPAIIRLITPALRMPPPGLRLDLVAMLRSLAKRFPREAGYILKQNLSEDRPDTTWLARQVLSEFPADIQTELHAALRQYNPQ